MTENGKELEELRRAHAALESRVDIVLPTLATKADLEALGARLSSEMHHQLSEMREMLDRRFGGIEHKCAETDKRIDKLQDRMEAGFNHIWTWIARSLIMILIALLGLFVTIMISRYPVPSAAHASPPAIAYHFHGQAPAPLSVAPPPQP